MRKGDALTDLVRRGRRRQVCHALVTAASLATAFALSGGILLLLVGTQILNWYWPVFLFLGSLAVVFYGLRKRILSGYEIAQELDGRLGFHDGISTAYYFLRRPDRAASPQNLIARQKQLAEELARSADLGRGMPFLRPRSLYLNAALAVLACGMFGLRYGMQRNLDLRPPLVRIAFDGFLGPSRDIAEGKRGARPLDSDTARDEGRERDQRDANSTDLKNASEQASDAAQDQSDSNLNKGDAKDKSKASGGADQNKSGDDMSESAEKEKSSQEKEGEGDSSSSPEGNSKSGPQSESGKNSNRPGSDSDNSSLTDKLRDALANLMAKLKSQPKPNQGQQGSSQSPNAQSGPKQNQNQDSTAKPENSQEGDANASGESQGDQQQGGTEQAAQGKSQGNSSDRPNSPDGKSGIGNQDGDKSAREAAELAAMGKISEIIGKRAANLTGDAMVEVTSGKQQLKTQYSQKQATHVDAGGEINRDEVPLAYQQYVQQYFDEIRKTPAAQLQPGAAEKTKAPAN